MRKFKAYFYVIPVLLSFAAYFSLYFLIDKPLTTGEIERLYEKKTALSERGEGRRVFIFAGSNGRFSHSCAIISQELDRYCGNLSVAAGIGLDFLLASYEPHLRAGDVIYMPLEFQQYEVSKSAMYAGPENSLLFKKHFSLLRQLGNERTIHAAFFPDEKYFIQGATEMLLQKKGIQRRFTEASVNAYGDQQGHTPEVGAEYSDSIASAHDTVPDLSVTARGAYATGLLSDFLRRAHQKGVLVIGGLPTTFNDTHIPAGTLGFLTTLYEGAGHKFVLLDNNSQYDRKCFFDKPYHLNSVCQKAQSLRVAALLKKFEK